MGRPPQTWSNQPICQEKRKRSKKRGGQPGHPGHSRPLYPVEACQSVNDYYRETCGGWVERLEGSDPNPYRHQVVEIPPIQLHVEEHRLHQLSCPRCAQKTRAVLPETVVSSGYGERVVAMVSLLSGMYRHSHRMVQSAMSDLLGVKMSLGTINRLRLEASEAVAKPVSEAQEYVQYSAIVGADETGFSQGNADGHNDHSKRAPVVGSGYPFGQFFPSDAVSVNSRRS